MENLLKETADDAEEVKAAIIHAQREDTAKRWRDELSEKYPNVEFEISYFGPVIGTHLGEGAIGITWYKVR